MRAEPQCRLADFRQHDEINSVLIEQRVQMAAQAGKSDAAGATQQAAANYRRRPSVNKAPDAKPVANRFEPVPCQ